MPELTVSMPAYNAERFIGESIQSILNQESVDFELIVVDDGSTDGTSPVVESFKDQRIKLIKNDKNKGIGYCHNLVIEASQSPFIMHVDSDDYILAGAFRKMLAKIKSDPNIGQVHCYYYDIDDGGTTTRESFRERRRQFLDFIHPHMNYRRELLIHGSVMNTLRTYRREVFITVGKFNERLTFGEDYEMAVRLIDKWDIALVPEFLYHRRVHGDNTAHSLRLKFLRFWLRRVFIVRRLRNQGQASYLREKEFGPKLEVLIGGAHLLRIPELISSLRNKFWEIGGIRKMIYRWFINSVGRGGYELLVKYMSWWPIVWFKSVSGQRSTAGKRIAYYLWQFPTLSETFIRREMTALIEVGFDVQVVADSPADLDMMDQEAKALMEATHFLYPEDEKRFFEYREYFLREYPFRYWNLALYVVFHRHGNYKNFAGDKLVFRKAIYLAGLLKDLGIDFVHTPWADKSTFVALVAARLLGVSYSVQARAHGIHRKHHLFALKERFTNARFIITNCHYNTSRIASLVNKPLDIIVVYEGLDLHIIRSKRTRWDIHEKVKILSVARLIEEKGLIYLLGACRRLMEAGFDFSCEIIGGPEQPEYTDYFVRLKKMHRQLGLEEHVLFRGVQTFQYVLEAYERSDIFVLPCVIARNGGRDITPNSLIEAMAMKLPVISTNLTAIPEIVEHGVSGILVPPNDEHALTKAIIDLIKDGERRRTLGENARRKIAERFDIKKNVDQYSKLFMVPKQVGKHVHQRDR